MTPSVLLIVIVTALSIALALLVKRFGRFRQGYHSGVIAWSRWLPVGAVGVYLAVLTLNLATGAAPSEPAMSLNGYFSTPEVVLLFLAGPLFLTRPGHLIAISVLTYCLQKLILGHNPGTVPALDLLTASATLVALMGDRMPWLTEDGPSLLAIRMRSAVLSIMSVSALFVLFAGMVKARPFAFWLSQTFGTAIPSVLVLALLVALFVGWLGIGLGYVRHLVIPLVSLPTMLVLAYVTQWPGHLLAVPFAACFCLSMMTAERRMLASRHSGGVSTTIVISR